MRQLATEYAKRGAFSERTNDGSSSAPGVDGGGDSTLQKQRRGVATTKADRQAGRGQAGERSNPSAVGGNSISGIRGLEDMDPYERVKLGRS